MKIQRLDPQTVALLGLDELFCELLRAIVPSADPGDSAAAHDRLYASPSAGAEPEFDADWREYVEPDLRAHFRSNLDLVAGDLRQITEPTGKKPKLKIPVAHLEGWINALNQARLSLASSHGFTELEMDRAPSLATPRGYVMFQIYFYGFLQECFLRELNP